MTLAEITMDGAAVGMLIAAAVAAGARVAAGIAAKKAHPRERAAEAIMDAIRALAQDFDERPTCPFLDGIPENVEQWARRVIAEAEIVRLKEQRPPPGRRP